MLCRNSIGNFCKAGSCRNGRLRFTLLFAGIIQIVFGKRIPEKSYIPSEFGDTVTVELVWYGGYGNCAADYLGLLKRQAGEMAAWLEAGFIQLGAYYMEDYFLFYDLAWGNVRRIHNEDIYEVEDWDDSAAVRAFMEREAAPIFPDFNTFLRFACLGEAYDEDEMIFPGTDQNSKS